tara:strand:+ start:3419 stop:3787 length:369 start_codon:yes stop_codon:yes gene_type:complete
MGKKRAKKDEKKKQDLSIIEKGQLKIMVNLMTTQVNKLVHNFFEHKRFNIELQKEIFIRTLHNTISPDKVMGDKDYIECEGIYNMIESNFDIEDNSNAEMIILSGIEFIKEKILEYAEKNEE